MNSYEVLYIITPELDEEATLFSKGKRHSVCRFCKKKKTEEFYPDGTLAKDLDNDPDDVKELQAELKLLGLYKKELTGKFDRATIDAPTSPRNMPLPAMV